MIKIDHISKSYKDIRVLDNISFEIEKGIICGFLGPNGAGKTTLMRILAGLIVPDEGVILIDGHKSNSLSYKKLGYMPEERGLYPKMKVKEQAVYLSMLKGMPRKQAEKEVNYWLDKLDISDWSNKRTEILSKGMHQKIQFLISVIHDPEILILDEPFSGLDPVNRDVLGNEILELQKKGRTIILSTHDMNSVEEFCNTVLFINKGNVVLEGDIEAIKEKKRSFLYEFNFTKNKELFIDQCEKINAIITSVKKKKSVYKITVILPDEKSATFLLQKSIPYIELVSFGEILPSMHEIFLSSLK